MPRRHTSVVAQIDASYFVLRLRITSEDRADERKSGARLIQMPQVTADASERTNTRRRARGEADEHGPAAASFFYKAVAIHILPKIDHAQPGAPPQDGQHQRGHVVQLARSTPNKSQRASGILRRVAKDRVEQATHVVHREVLFGSGDVVARP